MNSNEYPNISTAGRLANLYAGHMPRFEYECQDAAEEYTYRKGEGSSYTFLDGSTVTFFEEDSSHYGFAIDHNAVPTFPEGGLAGSVPVWADLNRAGAVVVPDTTQVEFVKPVRVLQALDAEGLQNAMALYDYVVSHDDLQALSAAFNAIYEPSPLDIEEGKRLAASFNEGRRSALRERLDDIVGELRGYCDTYAMDWGYGSLDCPAGGYATHEGATLDFGDYDSEELHLIADAIEVMAMLKAISDPV